MAASLRAMGDPTTSTKHIEQQCRRLIAAGADQGVLLRLIGGLAVRFHCPGAPTSTERDYRDLDLITASRLSEVNRVFETLGYEAFTRFNALHGHSRAIFYGTADGLKADVFLGSFNMCHKLPLGERLNVEELTVPLAELCLTKLQIVELNQKDLFDLYALLAEHPVGDGDRETINGQRIAEVCASDWGLYHTVELNLDRLKGGLGRTELPAADRDAIQKRANELLEHLEGHEKTRKWRLRAKVGERIQWYEEPDEVVDAR